MKKYAKFIFPAICVIIVAITFFMIFDLQNKAEEKNYNVNNIENENSAAIEQNETIVNNVENEISSVSEEDEISNENEALNKVENNSTASTIYEQSGDAGSTNKKEEAIKLVKQRWGEDDTVTFRCDSVTGSGDYIVAVISNSTGSVKNYFRVNLENNTVEVDY